MRITIAETYEYLNRVKKLLSEEEQKNIINYLAEHPKAGNIMQGTGGVRKLRWRQADKGKSGGVRIIYYFHSEYMPLYMLTIFGKSEKDNLTTAECNILNKLVRILVKHWME